MDSLILFEDSDIEMRDSDDDMLDECSQIFLENPICLSFHNRPSTSHWVTDHAEIKNYVCSDDVSELNEEALNINSIPVEILFKIFGYLSHNELGQIARVCQKWNMLTKDPVLWKKVTAHFLSSDHQFQATAIESFFNMLPPSATCLTLKFNEYFDDTEPLSFEAISAKLNFKCPQLQMLELRSTKLSDTIPSIINLCSQLLQNVRILLFEFCEFTDYPEREECVNISKIEILQLFSCELGVFNRPPFERMPHLKDLRLVNTDVDDSWFVDNLSFLNQLHVLSLSNSNFRSRTFYAIWNHAFNLKELYLCFTIVEDGDFDFNNPVFSNLKTICLSNFWEMSEPHVLSLVQSCQSLQNLHVHDFVFKRLHDPSFAVGNRCMSEILKENNDVHFHLM